MKNTITILGAIIFMSFIMASCMQNSSKEKELDLKEKELALKEKELALKEKGVLNKDSLINKNGNASSIKFIINPQNEGGPGQLSFSQNNKTIIYFEQKTQKGKIIINGTSYLLNKLKYDNKNYTYKITGTQITIQTAKCKFNNEEGGDCSHGVCPTITITLKGVSTTLTNIEFMDCLNFDF